MTEYFSAEYVANVPQQPSQPYGSYQHQQAYQQQQQAAGYLGGYNNAAYYQQHEAYQQQGYYPQQQQQQQQGVYAYPGAHDAQQYGGTWQLQPQLDHGAAPPQLPSEPQPPLPDGAPPLPDGPPPLPPMEQPPLPPEPTRAQQPIGFAGAVQAAYGGGQAGVEPAPAAAQPSYPPLPSQQSQHPPQKQQQLPGGAQQPYQQYQTQQHYQQPPMLQQQMQQLQQLQQYVQQSQQPQQYGQQYQAQQPGVQYTQQSQHAGQYPQQPYQPHLQQQPYPAQVQQGYYVGGWGSGGGQPYTQPAVAASHTRAPYSAPTASSLPPSQAAGPAGASIGPPEPQQQQAVAAQAPLQPQRKDITQLLQPPGRASRPKRLALILRGLPGSGKSHVARLVRDMEAAQGGEAPRTLSLDDYFMTEVEKEVEDEEAPAGRKGKKRKVQSMEYCYETEMEGVYKRSLLKAYQRTLEEGRFKFVIVDAPNTHVGDFRDYWVAGQAAGYEVFVVEMAEADPQVCHKRNQHGRSLEDLYRLSAEYEPTPAVYACLDVAGLLTKRVPGGRASISDVEMGEEEGHQEGDSDGEGHDAPSAAPGTSRWASMDDGGAPAADAARAKRARGDRPAGSSGSSVDKNGSRGSTASMQDAASNASYDGLTDGIDELLSGAGAASSARAGAAAAGGVRGSSSSTTRGILLNNGSNGRKRVRWPDQMEEDDQAETGFRIGTQSRQLETVYLESGLGPGDDGEHHPHASSFAAAVLAEHQVEANAFRNFLLGAAQKRLPSP